MQVLLIGPGIDVPGGVASLLRLLIQNPPSGIQYHLVSTMSAKTSVAQLRGITPQYFLGSFKNAWYFLKSLSGLSYLLKRERFDIAHVHFASWGSTLRKSLAVYILRRHHIPVVLHAHDVNYLQSFYMRIPKYLREWVDCFF